MVAVCIGCNSHFTERRQNLEAKGLLEKKVTETDFPEYFSSHLKQLSRIHITLLMEN